MIVMSRSWGAIFYAGKSMSTIREVGAGNAAASSVGEALCQVLRAGQDVHRCLAAHALGRIGYGPAVDPLIDALLDEDEDVRGEAAEALFRLGDPRAGDALVRNLVEDPCGQVKINATEALGAMGVRGAEPFLRRLAVGRDDAVAWDDEEFLGGGWDDWLDVQIKAIEALGALGARDAVSDIVAALDDEMGQDLSETAFRVLARLGEPGAEALARYATKGDARVRRRAVGALARSDTAVARAALLAALEDASADVRLAAFAGLAARDPAAACLAAGLDDPDPAIRAAAVRLCIRYWPDRLHALLDDPADAVQTAALDALTADPALAYSSALENLEFRLRVKLRGPSAEVAVAACRAVAALFPAAGTADLAEQLHDTGCPVPLRAASARALGEIGSEAAVEALRAAVGSDTRQVRLDAIAALARVAARPDRPARALEALLAAVRGELVPAPPASAAPEPVEIEVVETAPAAPKQGDAGEWPSSTLAALGIHDLKAQSRADAPAVAEPTIEPSAEATPDVEDDVPLADDDVPPDLTDEEQEFLERARQWDGPRRMRKHVPLEPDVAAHEDVRRFAARVMGDVPGPAVAAALTEALSGADPEVRRVAAESLGRVAGRLGGLGAPGAAALMDALGDEDRDLRLAAARALGSGGTTPEITAPGITAAVRGLLDDPDGHVRAQAARTLAALGAVGDEVTVLLDDPDPGVRQAGAEALAARGDADTEKILVEFAFAHEGMHGRAVARLLRDAGLTGAGARFLRVLADGAQTPRWRVSIEALEELHAPLGGPADALAA